MIQARHGLAALMMLACCTQLQARDPAVSGSTVSKTPAKGKCGTTTTTASTCCSKKADTLVARIMADLPQMTYRVDGLDTDSRELALGRAGDISRVQFVVGDQVFNTETAANEVILAGLQQRLAEMREIQYVVGDQRMTCPMSARALAAVNGEQVRYHVAGIEFDQMQPAVTAEQAVRSALAQFVQENSDAPVIAGNATVAKDNNGTPNAGGSDGSGWTVGSAQLTSAASASSRRSGADDAPRRYTPDDVIAANGGEARARSFVPPSRSTVAIRSGDGATTMPSMDNPGNGIVRGSALVPPGGCPQREARLAAEAAAAELASSKASPQAVASSGCSKGTAAVASTPASSGCSKSATTVAATANDAATSGCCKKAGATTASAPAATGCSKSATTVAAKANDAATSGCCKKAGATTASAPAAGGCSKSATTVAATATGDATSGCCKKAGVATASATAAGGCSKSATTAAAGATTGCGKQATTVAAGATSDCCKGKTASDCCKSKTATAAAAGAVSDCSKNKSATTVAAKAGSDCCMKAGGAAKGDCGKCPETQNVAGAPGTTNVKVAGVSAEDSNSEAAQYRAMIQRMVEAAATALQS